MKIDIVKIRENYRQNEVWEKDTKDELKQAVVELLADKEWHFEPVSYDKSHTDKIAGARVVDGEVQYCSARRGSWSCRINNGKREEIPTWLWLRWTFQHVSWWIKMYEILIAAKDTAEVCEPIQGDVCVAMTYKKPFEGVQVSSII